MISAYLVIGFGASGSCATTIELYASRREGNDVPASIKVCNVHGAAGLLDTALCTQYKPVHHREKKER